METKEQEKRFIDNSLLKKNFESLNYENADVVIITNCSSPVISLYNCADLGEDGKLQFVKSVLDSLRAGCNYKYEITKIVGNCYFCN